MKRFIKLCLISVMSFISFATFAENIVNVYTWSGVIPDFIIQQFEKETGIKVNFSTYDSNEIMYAKLKTDKNSEYDVIEPSSYFIDRMRRQNMLEKLNRSYLSNFKNINPNFLNPSYDKTSSYSIPFIWGITGLFVNRDYHGDNKINSWSELWKSKYADQLLILDDSREAFSMALLTLGFSANDTDPSHIHKAYLKLRDLLPNIKLFNSAPISLLIDEDTTIGMVWNGDLFKARTENPQLEFRFPKDGFVIWVDNFAIPKNAPHRVNAYRFVNFIMRADVAAAIALNNNYPTANLAAQKLLPESIRNDKTIYPSKDILRKGEFQTDVGDKANALYEKYWERLKIGG